MFSFGNKKQQAKDAEDPSITIQRLSKMVFDDPSELNQHLRELCGFLGTAQHDRADRALGQVVAVHATRSLSTLWTVLLQQMRECADTRVQLSIFKHFSNIADRIAIPQRTNAFDVFAKELMTLLGCEEIVGDKSFSKACCSAIAALGVHAEAGLCSALVEKLVSGIFNWGRSDAKRSAALIVSSLIRWTRHCGTYSALLKQIEHDRDPMGVAALVDSTIPLLLDQALLLRSSPRSYEHVVNYTEFVESWATRLLEETAPDPILLPIVAACFVKLRRFCCNDAFPHCPKILVGALRLLSSGPKKILVCPLLNLLSVVAVDSEHTNEFFEVCCRLTCSEDPMVRSDAFAALQTVSCLDPVRAWNAVYAGHAKYMAERCNVTLRGILTYVAFCAPTLDNDTFTQSFSRIIRDHSDFSNPINNNTIIQLLVLDAMLQGAIQRTSEMENAPLEGAFLWYILHCIDEHDDRVMSKAVEALLVCCDCFHMEEATFLRSDFTTMDFFEGVEKSSYYDLIPRHNVRHRTVSLRSLRNSNIVLQYFHSRMISAGFIVSNEQGAAVRSACTVTISVCEHLTQQPPYLNPLSNRCLVIMRSVVDLICSPLPIPMDTLHICLQCIAATAHNLDLSSLHGEGVSLMLHKWLFSFLWNMLVKCCEATDAMAVPKLPSDPIMYVAHHQLPPAVATLVSQAALSAMSSSDYSPTSQFSLLVEYLMKAFASVLSLGWRSEPFLRHMRLQYKIIVGCCEVFASSHPLASIAVARQLFCALYLLPDSATEQGDLKINFDASETQRATFVRMLIPVLNRALAFDLDIVGEQLFNFVELLCRFDELLFEHLAVVDAAAEAREPVYCYITLDPEYHLFRRICEIASGDENYNGVRGHRVVSHLIKAMCAALRSPHRAKLTEAIPIAGKAKCSVVDCVGAAQALLSSDMFVDCLVPLVVAEKDPSTIEKVSALCVFSTMNHWNEGQWKIAANLISSDTSNEAWTPRTQSLFLYAESLLSPSRHEVENVIVLGSTLARCNKDVAGSQLFGECGLVLKATTSPMSCVLRCIFEPDFIGECVKKLLNGDDVSCIAAATKYLRSLSVGAAKDWLPLTVGATGLNNGSAVLQQLKAALLLEYKGSWTCDDWEQVLSACHCPTMMTVLLAAHEREASKVPLVALSNDTFWYCVVLSQSCDWEFAQGTVADAGAVASSALSCIIGNVRGVAECKRAATRVTQIFGLLQQGEQIKSMLKSEANKKLESARSGSNEDVHRVLQLLLLWLCRPSEGAEPKVEGPSPASAQHPLALVSKLPFSGSYLLPVSEKMLTEGAQELPLPAIADAARYVSANSQLTKLIHNASGEA